MGRRARAAAIAAAVLFLAGCAAGTHPAGTGPSESTSAAASSAAPDPKALRNTTWLLVQAIVAGKTYDSPQPPGSSVWGSYTVQFVGDHLEANDGCNTIDVGVTIDARTVTGSGNASQTLVGCQESVLRNAYDSELVRGPVSWAVSAGRLTLTIANGDRFTYQPWPTGYPSDLAHRRYLIAARGLIDGVGFRLVVPPTPVGVGQCVGMEFDSPAGTPWEPISICRDDLAEKYVVNPTDFVSPRLPSDTGLLLSAVPNGSVSRIVYQPSGGGAPMTLTLTSLPGTRYQAFYGFVEHPTQGVVVFYDAKGKPYKDTWGVRW